MIIGPHGVAAIKHLFGGVGDCVFSQHRDGQIYLDEWDDSLGPQPTAQALSDAALDAKKSTTKQAIKDEASRRILAGIPDWKQRNLLARANELIRKEIKGTATVEESAELDALEAQKAGLDSVRAASDAAEAEVDALTTVEDIDAYDVTGW